MAAGLSLAWMNTGNAYLFNALFYVPAALAIFRLNPPAVDRKGREPFSLISILRRR